MPTVTTDDAAQIFYKAVGVTPEEFHYAFTNTHSPALTEDHEFEGPDHWTCGAPGWEAFADHALEHAEPAR